MTDESWSDRVIGDLKNDWYSNYNKLILGDFTSFNIGGNLKIQVGAVWKFNLSYSRSIITGSSESWTAGKKLDVYVGWKTNEYHADSHHQQDGNKYTANPLTFWREIEGRTDLITNLKNAIATQKLRADKWYWDNVNASTRIHNCKLTIDSLKSEWDLWVVEVTGTWKAEIATLQSEVKKTGSIHTDGDLLFSAKGGGMQILLGSDIILENGQKITISKGDITTTKDVKFPNLDA